jgi:ubiquitin-conjugating enzyme E2 S
MMDVQADIIGPVDTPYEGGVFRCKLAIEGDFPNNPPKGTILLLDRLLFHKDIPSQRV